MSIPPSEPVTDELDDFFGFSAAKKRAEDLINTDEDLTFIKHRVFINHVDSYITKYISAYLTDQVHGALKLEPEAMDEGAEQLPEEEPEKPVVVTGDKYEFIGTLTESFRKKTEDILYTIDEDSDGFMEEVVRCGYVIYDISHDSREIPKALNALNEMINAVAQVQEYGPKTYKNYSEERVFILISTIMTWAKTKPLDPDDPELAFSEIDYKKRKPHPNYKEHIACEREVVQKGKKFKEKLKTYVVCCGVIYGMEEQDLDFLFRMAWYHDPYLPVFGQGKNYVPLIHMKDLAKVLHGLMENAPVKPQYILAVEQTPSKLKDIVKGLSKTMGSGRVKETSLEEAFLIKDVNQKVYERLTVNINMEPVFIVENLQIEWQNELNLPENMEQIVAEFRESRKLHSLKVILHGPPASGKTTIAQAICKKYGTHYVNVRTMIEDTIAELTGNIEAERARQRAVEEMKRLKQEQGGDAESDEEEDDEEEAEEEEEVEGDIEEWEEQIRDIQTIMQESEDGRLPDDYVVRLMKAFLAKNICQNRGYVLDGYPKTLQQTKELFGFAAEGLDEEQEEGGTGGDVATSKLLPDFVLSLEASDDYLCYRVMNIEEKDVQGTHYTEESMIRRLSEFRVNNTEDNTMLNFFDENEIHPIIIDVSKYDQSEDVLMDFLAECIGEPVGFALSPDEEKELFKLLAEQKKLEDEKQQIQEEESENKAAEEYHEKMERWTSILEQLQMEEEKLLMVKSKPLRKYLMQYVFPTLTKALIELAKLKPDDPVDFLAEYLFRENPEGSMFDPSFTRNGEGLLKEYHVEIQEIIEELAEESTKIN